MYKLTHAALCKDIGLPRADSPSFVTIFTLPQAEYLSVTVEWMRKLVSEYQGTDDVFCQAFLATVVFHSAQETTIQVTSDAREYLKSLGNQHCHFDSTPGLLPGPYVQIGQQLREAWKVVPDTYGTAMVTLKPQSRYAYEISSNILYH